MCCFIFVFFACISTILGYYELGYQFVIKHFTSLLSEMFYLFIYWLTVEWYTKHSAHSHSLTATGVYSLDGSTDMQYAGYRNSD